MHPWLRIHLERRAAALAAGVLLTFVVSGLNLVGPVLSGSLVDRVVVGGDKSLLWPILGAMAGAILVKSLIRYGYQMLFERASQATIRACREELFAKLQRMDFGYFDRTKTGDVMAHMTGDIDAVRHMIAWVAYQTCENGSVLLASLAALFLVNWKLTLAMFAATPLLAFFTLGLSREVKPTFAAIREQFSRLNSVVQENIAGNRVVRAFSREDYEIEKFQAENDAYRDRNVESARVWAKYIPAIEFTSGLLPVILILVGGWMIIRGSLSLGQLVTFNGLVWAIAQPLRMAGWLVNDMQRFSAAADRLDKLYSLRSAVEEGDRKLAPARVRGRVEFRDVSFSYGDERVLEGLSFVAEPGQTIGIIGPTGSGKSSVGRLLCRYYDRDSGDILLDGIDVRDWDLDALRSSVGVTMQDIFLFSDTIEGNIAFGAPETGLDEVLRASELANAHEFVRELPEGYDTIIGERGVGLSGGQRQRVALARLLLVSPPVMILDDTTSAVDVETEERIQDSIRALRGERTLIVIAHRVSTIMHADTILVIKDGRAVERGSHEELVALGGYYAEVFRHQTRSEGPAGEAGRG